ncbi:hypothetical protein J4464_05835 [Candidatus Woesearchaeota archaeon]|nr:hypothetical protein [Candidatus Woesearchaeota archaeon]
MKQVLINGLWILMLILLGGIIVAQSDPSAPTAIQNVSTMTTTPSPGAVMNSTGGSILTLDINATTQNYRWKGFVGNVTGELALLDSALNRLVTWNVQTITGELYATRNSTLITWSAVQCANNSVIAAEQEALNITTTDVDSINTTFSGTTHRGFYIGITQIAANTCRATALNVNNTQQSNYFQEILLSDRGNLIYTSLLENATYGFNNQTYDFQMIVAENALQGSQPSTPYYFYIELI